MLTQEAEAGLEVLEAELARYGILLGDVLQRLRLQDYHRYLVRIAELCRQVCAASELVSIDRPESEVLYLGRLLRICESNPVEITIWERLFGSELLLDAGPYKFGLFRSADLDDPDRAMGCVPAMPKHAFLAIHFGVFGDKFVDGRYRNGEKIVVMGDAPINDRGETYRLGFHRRAFGGGVHPPEIHLQLTGADYVADHIRDYWVLGVMHRQFGQS